MAIKQGQRYVRVELSSLNYYLYEHVKIEKEETIVMAKVESGEVVFLVEKVDAKEGS
ncbi:hypothetical protein LCGC14_2749920 [marine sediment metagenome]|uniref:Uncharacterized protein n=1 Tax=marine sediment metagenome TaxID=412755 RepID=A0A0F8Z287_9ZZZZ